jgi:hypothetical protein
MRKIALFVALAMIAASPAMAAKKKAKPAQPAMTEAEKANDNSYRLVRDSLPMWLPSWAQPVYHYGVKPGMEANTTKPAKTTKKKAAAKTN